MSSPLSDHNKQGISRIRRNYTQWVNDHTLEDFSLRFTAKKARKWSFFTVSNTALGATSFLALEAIGATITIKFGFENALIASLIVSLIIFLAGLPIAYYCAKYGTDIDLLTRGAGFGYIGSTITSLIYASFTFIFFALEAAIMAKALELLFDMPLALGYVVSSVLVIPLAFFGITFLNRFQCWTQPLWLLLHALPLGYVLLHQQSEISAWFSYQGEYQAGQVNWLFIGAAASVMFALMAQIGEQVDVIRFLPPKQKSNTWRWWSAVLMAGPGWIIIGFVKIMFGSLLAFIAIEKGAEIQNAVDPTHMYLGVFLDVFPNATVALIAVGVFVIVSQLKINVINAYAGSIAWSNFFSRLTHSHPGRVVWLIFNVSIALVLMELGVYRAFENTLSVYAIVAVAWMGCLVADLMINKPLGLSPKHIEFKRAYLHAINPVGVGSMAIASLLGIISYLGVLGSWMQASAHFITLFITFLLMPLLSILTRQRYYLARNNTSPFTSEHVECCVCLNHYEQEDMAMCPAYNGPICSLCCSLDTRCLDVCKESNVSLGDKIKSIFSGTIFKCLIPFLSSRFFYFLAMLCVIASLLGVLLLIIYNASVTVNPTYAPILYSVLWKVFVILMIVGGVLSWLFVLSTETRVMAQQESQRQTLRLLDEIDAHSETDKQLQIAKDAAEAANNAKSRYLTGISHELRTPLNSVLGYAQMLENNLAINEEHRRKISVIRRSSEHLADLIEGLLDISKIEAGKIELQRDNIHFTALINQIVSMFRLQASDKGLEFIYIPTDYLPEYVCGDEKRVRQILINLLSNAIKFTEQGHVTLKVYYRNQVAQFHVSDSGRGIPEDEMERIFLPFERVRRPGAVVASGTGLGLSITRLLINIMGGDITVENNISPLTGATFSVSLMLSTMAKPHHSSMQLQNVYGYKGERKSVMVVDDEAAHRALLSDILMPLGFIVFEAYDGESCLELLNQHTPDMILLDRMMPNITGPEIAKKVRERGIGVPIMIISANANEDLAEIDTRIFYDDYLPKPVKISVLIEKMGKHMHLDWVFEPTDQKPDVDPNQKIKQFPPAQLRQEINEAAEIGNLRLVKKLIKHIADHDEACIRYIEQVNRYIDSVQLDKIITLNQGH